MMLISEVIVYSESIMLQVKILMRNKLNGNLVFPTSKSGRYKLR